MPGVTDGLSCRYARAPIAGQPAGCSLPPVQISADQSNHSAAVLRDLLCATEEAFLSRSLMSWADASLRFSDLEEHHL